MTEAFYKALARETTPVIQKGESITLGWNGAKLFADRGALSGCTVRIEAVGFDWVVIRYEDRAYAYGFSPKELETPMRHLLED